MLGWLWVFFLATLGHAIITLFNFWQLTNAEKLTLFGIKFSSLWTFWLAYCISLIPVFVFINFIFLYSYWYGYNVLFPGKAWRVQETYWFSSLVVMFFMAWLYLGELPTKNAVIALIFLVGALIAILWK